MRSGQRSSRQEVPKCTWESVDACIGSSRSFIVHNVMYMFVRSCLISLIVIKMVKLIV